MSQGRVAGGAGCWRDVAAQNQSRPHPDWALHTWVPSSTRQNKRGPLLPSCAQVNLRLGRSGEPTPLRNSCWPDCFPCKQLEEPGVGCLVFQHRGMMISGCPEQFSPPFWGLDNFPGRCAGASPSLPRVDIRAVRRGHRSPRGPPGGGAQAPGRCCHTANLGCSACLQPAAGFRPRPQRGHAALRCLGSPTCAAGRPQRLPPWVLTIKGLVFECLKAGPGHWQSTPAPGETPPPPLPWCPHRVRLQTWPLRANFLCQRGHTDPGCGRRPCQRPPARVTALPAGRAGLCPHLQSQPLPKERYQPHPTRWMLRPERLPKAPWRPPGAPTSPSC